MKNGSGVLKLGHFPEKFIIVDSRYRKSDRKKGHKERQETHREKEEGGALTRKGDSTKCQSLQNTEKHFIHHK